jgi:hypothetical protein
MLLAPRSFWDFAIAAGEASSVATAPAVLRKSRLAFDVDGIFIEFMDLQLPADKLA